MRVIHTSFLALLISMSSIVFSQPITINGKVTNDRGEAAAGITVTEKGTKTSVLTDSSGTFSIAVSKIPSTLFFQGVAYAALEYRVTERNYIKDITVTLHVFNSELAEIVVVGYAKAIRSAAVAPTALRRVTISGKSAGLSIRKDVGSVPMKLPSGFKNEGSRPGVLTAGELSDFKKWKLWSDYSNTDFKTWSNHWGIRLNRRYSVQVQNQDHNALVGEKVYLVNYITKDTVWSALTDNTGKAELWANVSNQGNENTRYFIGCRNKEITSPSLFENGINRLVVNRPCNISNTVDIAFVVDATGSMGDEIQYLQEELRDIISRTADKYSNIQLRTGAVFYRDHGDEYLTRFNDFHADPSNLISFIKKQSARGGGDIPEAVEDALSTALDSLQWNEAADAKMLFLVLDAPPHDAAKTKMYELITKAAKRGIRIVPVVCSGIDKSTEYLMRCIALATNGSYVFLTDDSGVGNAHIKPTTDELTVELLNNLLQRLISEMIYAPACNDEKRVKVANEPVDKEIKVKVYPNPTHGNIYIEYSDRVEEMFITDFAGKVLMKVNASDKKGKTFVDLTNFPSATYLLKYLIKDKGWGTHKVVLMQ